MGFMLKLIRRIAMYVVLVYDIKTDEKGKKILPKVFKLCKKYLAHIQNSVFEGELSVTQLKELEIELNKLIRDGIDSVIIFKCRQEKWLEKIFIGIREDADDNFI